MHMSAYPLLIGVFLASLTISTVNAQTSSDCLGLDQGCGATIESCCPGLTCVFHPPLFFGVRATHYFRLHPLTFDAVV